MQIDGDVQLLALRQDGPVLRVIQVGVAEIGVGVPTFEAQLLDAALEFLDGVIHVLGSERRPAAEAIGILGDGGGQDVVGVLSYLHTHFRGRASTPGDVWDR